MRISVAALLAVVLGCSELALAQQEIPKLVESIDVRVIQVDVVVTDRKGNAVTGLDADDFMIFENGIPKTITNFYEVGSGRTVSEMNVPEPQAPAPAAPAETPQSLRRKFIIFIDNLSLNPLNRNTVVENMKKFVTSTMRPGDQAMVATWNRSMKIRVPFTSDAAQIIQMLDVVKGETGYGVHNLSERRDVESRIRDATSYSDAISAARGYAQSVEHDARQTVTALTGLMSTLAGVDGKKVLVLTTEGLPVQAGKEMFYFVDDMARTKRSWQNVGSALMEGTNFDTSSLIQTVARAANANGITIYPLHAGGLAAYNTNSAENQAPVSLLVQQAALSNSTDSLQMIADMTGGKATIGTNNFTDAFRQIERDISSYYSLGYRSGTERVDRQRSLEVRPKNRNHVVRYRRSFVEKSTRTEMSDRVVANLFYENRSNDLKILVKTGQPVASESGNFLVPVEIHIPMDALTLIPQGEQVVGGFSVYVVVSNSVGDMSDVQQQTHQIRIPPSEMEKTKGKFYTYELRLIMEKGRNRISIGVVDDISNTTGFEKQEILAADLR